MEQNTRIETAKRNYWLSQKKKQQPKNGAFFGLNTQIYVITEILN